MRKLLVVDDDPLVRKVLARAFQDSDVEVRAVGAAGEGLEEISRSQPDVVILDVLLPDLSGLDAFQRIREIDPQLPVIFITSGGASETAIEAMKLGAFDYLVKPLNLGQLRALVAQAVSMRRLMRVPVQLAEDADDLSHAASDVLIGRCPQMQDVYKAIGRIARQNVTVLIRGESGTGKELVARAIYHHSDRSRDPFLAVNCAALPESLLESELFGHERGAFTGAESQRIGKFEQCSGGTLFLDEIGDMSPLTQSKILRLVQEQQFQRVGGTETIKTDVRLIAATNCDLEEMIAGGQFRPDLYYRLSVFEITLPPLRERTSDFPYLVQHFVQRFGDEHGKDVQGVSPDALEILRRHPWPGNVRELQSVLKQAVLRATGPVIVAEFLPPSLRVGSQHGDSAILGDQASTADFGRFISERLTAGSDALYAESIELLERTLISSVLQHTGGNQAHTARILGITRGSLRNKIRALGIERDGFPKNGHAPQQADAADEPAEASSVDAVLP